MKKFLLFFSLTVFVPGLLYAQSPVMKARDAIAARLIAKYPADELLNLDPKLIEQEITPDERKIFATQHWAFDVNVPVVVSILRDIEQPTVPFWLSEAEFQKTDLRVRNEQSTYEVWQKKFPAGRIELGINGLDKHRPHYMVAVRSVSGEEIKLSNFFPSDQQVSKLQKGAYFYHDWPDLLVTEVPKELEGQLLLQTIRGRARDAHLIEAFRKSPVPSSTKPDSIVLTWSEDPMTTQTVQWRTSPGINSGKVLFRQQNKGGEWGEIAAEVHEVSDFLVVNDPRINHYTATLHGLKPGTTYEYKVGTADDALHSEPASFTTAPESPSAFTFLCFSDTHNSPVVQPLYDDAVAHYPKLAFWSISGDLVGTGQYRENWDTLFAQCAGLSTRSSLMPSLGNHDAIDGLGADLYCQLFELPKNGPKTEQPECAYSFNYGNAFFIMPDVTASVTKQTQWMDDQLSKCTATWKFAIFHFPPYGPEPNSEPDIIKNWVPLFDKYHVDFALSGHVHNYMRTYPLKNGERVASPKDGTIYLIGVAVKGDRFPRKPPYAEAVVPPDKQSEFFAITVDGNKVDVRAEDETGATVDSCTVQK